MICGARQLPLRIGGTERHQSAPFHLMNDGRELYVNLGLGANGFGALLLSGGLCGLEGGQGLGGNAGELGVLLGGELFEVLDRLGKF